MITIEILDGEISQLEQKEPTYVIVERLAWLYIVRDHIRLTVSEPKEETVQTLGESDFLKACSGKPTQKVLSVVNEAMETIQVLHPKLYQAVLDKLS